MDDPHPLPSRNAPPFRRWAGLALALVVAIAIASSGLDRRLVALGEVLPLLLLLAFHRAELRREAHRHAERERMLEDSIRQSKDTAAALARALPDGLVRLGRGGAVLEVLAPGDAALAGFLERGAGRRVDSLFPGGSARALADVVGEVLDPATTGPLSVEIRTEGPRRTFEVHLVRVLPDECLAVLRDVTEARQLAEKLLVNDRLASLGTLATGVAHEINNPLAYVTANVEYALRELKRARPDELAPLGGGELVDALREAQMGTQRIAAIVASLKKQARQEDEPVTAVDCRAAVETAIRMLEARLRHHARLEVDIEDVPAVMANAQRLVQVVMNLLSNAIDALPERATDANRIRVSIHSAPDGRVSIEVTDNGMGIPAETRDKIFDPFFTTKAPGAGTGLGLYLSHQFVASFGGELAVESTPGDHTTFRITLRTAERAASNRPARSDAEIPRCKFLVVDDEVLVGRALARALGGHEVITVSDGAAALAICASDPPDVIVCDVMMPNVDGPTFHARLSAVRPDLARRIVFMTGGAFTQECKDFLAKMENPRIDKPVDPRELLRIAGELRLAKPPRASLDSRRPVSVAPAR